MEQQMPIFDLGFSATTTKLTFLLFFLSTLNNIYAERDFNFKDSQVPLLEAKDEPHHVQDPYVLELTQSCQHAESEIILSLILKNRDWHNYSDIKKAKLHEKLSKFFAIPKEFIAMDSITKHDMYTMQKESMRRGNNKSHFSNKHLGRVSFKIGCGTSLFKIGRPISKQISSQIKDGSLDNITDEKFGWWIIWRKQLKSRSHRNRRQAEGSGEDDFEDDYDYDDDEEEEPVENVTEMPNVPAHAHRHHHGDAENKVYNESQHTSVENNQNTNYAATTTSSSLYPDDNNNNMVPSSTLSSFLSSSTPSTSTAPTTISPTYTPVPEITSSLSTYASTDYVETKIENMPPMIKTRLQKFAVTSGKSFRFTIPEDAFIDNEDNTNLRLELTDKDGHELKQTSWLQFNVGERELYGLPLDDAVSKWHYRLTATDSGNESITETLEISVQQHRGVRTVNHEINISVKINEKGLNNIDWQLKLMQAIATTLGDDTVNSIVVREIRQTVQDPHTATFVYFNETLPTVECPEADLNYLIKSLDASRLTELTKPTLGIKSITGSLIGSCQKSHDTKPKLTTHVTKNWPPMPRNQVDRVNATVGHLLVYKVPSDTFYDPNDNELKLILKTKENKDLNPRHWLQFDSKNEEFFGIPKSGDIGSEEYLLVAEDSGGLSATDALVVVVSHAPKKEFSAYFKAFLAIRHEQFTADLQRKFVERISALHGDNSMNYIQIRSVTTHHDSDGTIVNFYNTTLYKTHNRCPEKEIEATRNVYLQQDYLLRDRVKKSLGPELNLTNLSVIPLGSCHPQTDITHREFIPTKTDEPLLKSTFSEEYMTTIILPAVIIISMILVASIIACCLHRRRVKSGKMELGNEEERKSFHTKGIPVIFQDELDEKPETGNKSPIILKDEKPPLLPPSYNTTNMNGDNDVDEYVPPPAVIVGGREVRGKSPATPSYRKPPPYVSP